MSVVDGVLELRVVQARREADAVVSLTLEDPYRRLLPPWRPGAHVDLYLGDEVRQYSLCGDTSDMRSYRVGVLREASSRGGSAWVHDVLRVGDAVDVGGPRNHFELVDAPSYVFIAGGIGITPILAMLREVERRGRAWSLHYGGRRRSSMGFLSELDLDDPRVVLWPQDERGLIDLDSVVGGAAPGAAVYCCGPEQLIAAVETAGAGLPDGTVHVERFASKPVDPSLLADDVAFDVVVGRSGPRVTVEPGTSILEALARVGTDLPNACRDGVCGSCLTRVIAGEPEHRDSLLRPDETDKILPCISRARTPELVLDL